MQPNFTLIHLVSEQTLQNLLPIMALRPHRIVQVRSRGRNLSQSRSIEAAIRHLCKENSDFVGYTPRFVDHELTEAHPTLNQVYADLAQRFSDREKTLLNYTGGTKMMSVGAFQLALQRNIPTVYCDTVKRRFVWAPEKSGFKGLDFDTLATLLTVSLIATANGQAPDSLRSKDFSNELLTFGRIAWRLKSKPTRKFNEFEGFVRKHFRCDDDRIPSSRAKLDELLRRPLPIVHDEKVLEFVQAAASNGLLNGEGTDFFPICRSSDRRGQRSELETLSNLLGGSWLELFVVDLLSLSHHFGDVRWSLEPVRLQDRALGETDVVCVDRQTCRLLVISCKQSLQQSTPLEHMEALVQRTRTLGGSHARPVLAVLRVRPDEQEKFRHWAKSLGVDLLISDQIIARFQSKTESFQ